jgi:hypothetical protein
MMQVAVLARGIVSALGVPLLAALPLSSLQAQQASNPWTPDRASAVVRIEVGSNVGTGFLVKGFGIRYFVLTATHVVLPDYKPTDVPPSGCLPVLEGTRLFQGNTGGAVLRAKCAYHVGSDTSLIELSPRDDKYPILELAARDLAVGDLVTPAGFPSGGDRDTQRTAVVTSTTAKGGLIVTDALTAPGMSGGPYLDTDGKVVGIHQAGVQNVAGFPHMRPIVSVRPLLELYLPPIPVSSSLRSPTSGPAAEGQCRKENEEKLLTERVKFTTKPAGVSCERNSKSRQWADITYDVTKEMPGYTITGFVSHDDKVSFGWVGMLRYEFDDRLGTTAVKVPVGCDVSSPTAEREGFAETTLSGFVRKIAVNDEDRIAIKKVCEPVNK